MGDLLRSYRTNRAMREAYFHMNGYREAEIYDACERLGVEDGADGYAVFIHDGDLVGSWINETFATVGQARGFLAEYAPELEVNE